MKLVFRCRCFISAFCTSYSPLHPEPLDLVLQELVDAFLDGLHGLAGAGDTEILLRAGDEQALGNRPGLDASPSTVEDLVFLTSVPSSPSSGLARSRTSLAAARAEVAQDRERGNQMTKRLLLID